MYNVYVKKQGQYNPDMVGEFSAINDAIALAQSLKEKDETKPVKRTKSVKSNYSTYQ